MRKPKGKQWGPNSIRAKLWSAQNGRCCYCLAEMHPPCRKGRTQAAKSATLEHLLAKKDGGENHRHNYALACRACNMQRDVLEMNWLEFATYKQDGPEAFKGQEQ